MIISYTPFTPKNCVNQAIQSILYSLMNFMRKNKMHKSSFITGFIAGLLVYWTFSSGLVKINIDANALPFADEPNATKPAWGG